MVLVQKAKLNITRWVLVAVAAVILALIAPIVPANAASCNGGADGAMYLYDEYNYYGRRLGFWDRGWWQNLWDYSFDNRASSVWNNSSCTVYLAEHQDGGGYWIVLQPGQYYNLGYGWNNRISSLYIN